PPAAVHRLRPAVAGGSRPLAPHRQCGAAARSAGAGALNRLTSLRVLRAGALAVGIALGVAFASLGYFTAAGAGAGAASVGSVGTSTVTTATPGAGTVALTWSGVPPPNGAGTVSYSLLRDGGSPGGNCPSSAAPTAVTTCTDSGLSSGTYHYTVTAHWRSWTTTSPV